MNLIFEVGIEKIETRADSTLKVILGTQELGDEEIARLFKFRRLHAFCMLSDKGISEEQENALKGLETGNTGKIEGKSLSQRLRSVLWVLFKQDNVMGDFDDYYADMMEKLIEHFKEKLD